MTPSAGMPEPNWEVIKSDRNPDGSKTITPRVDRDAKRVVTFNLGRRWSRRHDIAYVAYMVKNGYLPADDLVKAREEYRNEQLTARKIRHEAGLTPNHGFRITN